VVTASEDQTAQVWDASSGRPVGEPLRHDSWVSAASFSPDGHWVVTASEDKTARVWEAASGRPVGEPLRHDGQVNAASFSPDGRWVVTASVDRTARVWEAASGRPVGKPLRHAGAVTAASFSPDGRWVVTTSWDFTARVWEAASGQPVGVPMPHADMVEAASFSPDGRWVVTASVDTTAQVWEAASGRPVGEPLRHVGGAVTAASFSPDGCWVVTAGGFQALVWETASCDEGKEMPAALVALAGRRVSDDGLLVDVPIEERLAWRDRLLATPQDGSEWDRLLRWYLADPRTRTISPRARLLTVPQHIEREIDWVMAHPKASNAAAILNDAYSLDPSHPLILFALSAVEKNPATQTFYRDLGLKRLPADARLCARAAEILKAGGDRPRALAAAEKALALDPRSSPALAVQAWARAEPVGGPPATAAAPR
jgi:roadblock/LC7 domain-containing protein